MPTLRDYRPVLPNSDFIPVKYRENVLLFERTDDGLLITAYPSGRGEPHTEFLRYIDNPEILGLHDGYCWRLEELLAWAHSIDVEGVTGE